LSAHGKLDWRKVKNPGQPSNAARGRAFRTGELRCLIIYTLGKDRKSKSEPIEVWDRLSVASIRAA
jgi:hypothetical protein